MSEISTTPHSGVAIGKYKCLVKKKQTMITAINSFVKNRQSAAVNVNRVLHVIVEHVRVGTGSVLAFWSKQGWYLSYFAFLSKQGWYLNCFASITIFTYIINLHLQFTCVAVSVETKTDQEFVLSNRTPWPDHLSDGYRIIQLSCLLKRTLFSPVETVQATNKLN